MLTLLAITTLSLSNPSGPGHVGQLSRALGLSSGGLFFWKKPLNIRRHLSVSSRPASYQILESNTSSD